MHDASTALRVKQNLSITHNNCDNNSTQSEREPEFHNTNNDHLSEIWSNFLQNVVCDSSSYED